MRRLAGTVVLVFLALTGSVAVGVATEPAVGTDGIEARGHGPVGSVTGDCETVAIQSATVTVTVSRPHDIASSGDLGDLLGGERSVTVVVTASGERRERSTKLDDGERQRVSVGFEWPTTGRAEARRVPAEVVVSTPRRTVTETNRTISLPAIAPGTGCEG